MSVRTRMFGPPAPKMPPGLIELMDGLARDVLKNNPENIYEFCALHMHKLLEIRDGRAPKPLITLEQRIATAQLKVKQRAEQRQREYDEKIGNNTNKKEESLTTNVPFNGQDFEEKKDLEEITAVAKGEEKQDIITTEEKSIANATELIPTKINFDNSDNEVVLTTCINEEGIKDENNPETSTAVESYKIEALNEENNVEHDKESAINDSKCNVNDNVVPEVVPSNADTSNITKDVDIDNRSLSNETTVTLKVNDVENIENEIDSQNKDTKDVDIGSGSLSNETTVTLKVNDTENMENDIVSPNKDNSSEAVETDRSCIDNETALPNESENEMSDTRNGSINSTEYPDSHHNIYMDKIEVQIIEPTINDAENMNDADSKMNNETDSNLIENEAIDSNQSDTSQDEKILAVILSSENAESSTPQIIAPDSVKSKELEVVQIKEPETQNNESEKKLGTETVLESTDNKTNNINSSMDLETAAVTIQKVFRSFLFKTKTASYDDPTTVDISLLTQDKEKVEIEVLNVKDRRPLGISRMDTVLQTVNEEKSLSLSTDDSSTLSSAATIIQAHVRGFLVRNKYNSNKTISSNSFIDSDAPSIPSLEADSDNRNSKTVLNIHIVPEGGHFVSRDESLFTSMDLSLDSSPPSSVNLHPLGYDKSERRKQLKREDAIQSVSPPSNNSGKLSEDHDSVKEILTVDNNTGQVVNGNVSIETQDIVPKVESEIVNNNSDPGYTSTDAASDEMDVITPYVEDKSSRESDNTSKLLHSGEFHDIVLPTNVTRSDASVVREFQNVLVYFILWNN